MGQQIQVTTTQEKQTLIIQINSIYTFIALNLHLLTDSNALDPSRIQSHSPLTICLITYLLKR